MRRVGLSFQGSQTPSLLPLEQPLPAPHPMPPQDLPPGLYDHPLSAASHQVLASQPQALHHLEPLDPAEAPQRLARYLRQLSEIALAALPQTQRQQQQLGWLPPHLAGAPHPEEDRLSRALAGLLHLDDPERLRAFAAALAASASPDPDALAERERRQWGMLTAQLYCFAEDARIDVNPPCRPICRCRKVAAAGS